MEVIVRADDNFVLLHLCTVCQNVSHNQITVLLKTHLPWTIIFFIRAKKKNKRRSGFIYSRIKSPDPSRKSIESHCYIIINYHNWKETAHFQFAKFCWRRHMLPTSFWILTSTACCDKETMINVELQQQRGFIGIVTLVLKNLEISINYCTILQGNKVWLL